MKQIISSIFIMLMLNCKKEKPAPQTSNEIGTLPLKKLEKINLPTEVIQVDVKFVGNPVITNKSIVFRYELNILNNFKVPFTLKSLEIYNLEKTDTPISKLDSTYINRNFDRPGGTTLDDIKFLEGNDFGVLNIELIFPEQSMIPQKIFHKLYFERQKSSGEFASHPMEVAIVEIPELTTLSLGLPFKQKGQWLYETDSHQGARQITEGQVTYPQRFAVDWMLINTDGSFAKGNIKANADWKTYGVEIIAVADGEVVNLKDDIKENEPLSEKMAVRMNKETIGGNYVVLDIGNNTYASYGHLMPNSLKVKIGDRVKKGQVLALLGNSGNSDCPHLHFQLETKSSSFFGGEGVAYTLPKFAELKSYSEEEITGFFKSNMIPSIPAKKKVKTNVFPIGYGLVEIK
ncbi:M23 family metallopeptidase [Maribacter chungangensis]|uniref:M23 family metallopeptidase n=1 Tax=Maribacter chungangensis TaxID=1069117 RepID=A0ABW3B138_9FLAO